MTLSAGNHPKSHPPINGIPNPDKPSHWLVPSWSPLDSFVSVVQHFHRFSPSTNSQTMHMLVYYRGYAAALDAAFVENQADALYTEWCENLRASIGRCLALWP